MCELVCLSSSYKGNCDVERSTVKDSDLKAGQELVCVMYGNSKCALFLLELFISPTLRCILSMQFPLPAFFSRILPRG